MKRKLIALQVERNRAHGRSMLEGIAAACGYTSPQYFAHVFATAYNQTPNDWRKANA